jgi:hypothetical protein
VRRRAPTLSDLEIYPKIYSDLFKCIGGLFLSRIFYVRFLLKDSFFFVCVYGDNFIVVAGEAQVVVKIFRGCRGGSL